MAQRGQWLGWIVAAHPIRYSQNATPLGTYRVVMSSKKVGEESESSEGSHEVPGAVIGHGNLVCRGREV